MKEVNIQKKQTAQLDEYGQIVKPAGTANFCSNCGSKLPLGAKFCPNCGHPIEVKKSVENGHEWVDLGLSVKWATCNVGATKPEEYGAYFAWGETTPKSMNTNDNYNYQDNPTILPLAKDAAHANWGGKWRMPTKAEQDELRNKCTWELKSQNGMSGYMIKSKINGKSIFLPAAGYRDCSSLNSAGFSGYYWSSSCYLGYPTYANYIYFKPGSVDWNHIYRYRGHSIRPVCQ